MAKSSDVLISNSKRSTKNDIGWPKLISFLNLLCLAIIFGSQFSARPDRFESFTRFPKGTSATNWKRSIQMHLHCPNVHDEEGSFVPYYLTSPLCSLMYFLEGPWFSISSSVFYIFAGFAAWAIAYVEVAHKPSLVGTSASVLLVLRSVETGSEQKKSAILGFFLSMLIIYIHVLHLDRLHSRLYSGLMSIFGNITLPFYVHCIVNLPGCQRMEPQNVRKPEEHDKPDAPIRNPEELCKKLASSTNISQQKISTPPQQSKDMNHNTESLCRGAHEKSTDELLRTSSSGHRQQQQQQQESHHPESNTTTPERRTRRWKRYSPDTQTTPQDTHERSKRQRASNDQRRRHFYMDSGAAYHSTFDPSVIKSYPAHLNIKPPIQSIQGFGGSTILVTGYGYIDGPVGKLEHVLLLPDSTANLMCLGQLTRDYPVKVVFYRDKFWIEGLHNGERIGEGHREDINHYVVDSFQPDSLLINKRKPSKKKTRQYTR